MNKIAKGAIAGGLGVALLLGGAGTLAYWTGSASVGTASTITAGNLAVTSTGTGTWTKTNNGTTTTINDIASFKIVPGDKLTYSRSVTITAVGDNLKATASLGTAAITAATTGDATANAALATALGASAVVQIDGAATATITPASASSHTVTATIDWPFGTDGTGNTAKTGAVDLSGFNVTVTQVAP